MLGMSISSWPRKDSGILSAQTTLLCACTFTSRLSYQCKQLLIKLDQGLLMVLKCWTADCHGIAQSACSQCACATLFAELRKSIRI